MCGIVASFNYGSGPGPSAQTIVRIRETMVRRGPDGAGYWSSVDRRVQLAHRRLSIIDPSEAASQPLLSRDKMLALTFNGEIYNYRALRRELEQAGYHFQSRGDAEVILALYSLHGSAMLRRLRGMFAFALWDERRGGLLVARDPYGIKPLYYADDGNSFLAASQVKSLSASGAVNTVPNPAGHVGFLLWGHVPEPHTMFRAIRSLGAGVMLWLDRNGRRTWSEFCTVKGLLLEAEAAIACRDGHGSVRLNEAHPDLRNSSARQDFLQGCLRDSVHHHLVADVPVGVFLSSGIDSTAVTALASRGTNSLQTITLGFEEFKGTPQDETAEAMSTARQLGTQHRTVWISQRDFEFHCQNVVEAMDQPSIDGVNAYLISLAASQAGLKVALSGIGGDELFGGYPSFKQVPAAARWLGLAGQWRCLGHVFRIISGPLLRRLGSPKFAGLLEYGGSYGGAYLLQRGLFMPWELPSLLDPTFVRAGWAELEPLLRLDQAVAGLHSTHLKITCLESTGYLQNQLLRDADWAGMSHSVEIRVPFADVELLRQVAPLAALGRPASKRDLACACGSPLGESAVTRPKRGFFVPLPQWRDSSSRTSPTGHRGHSSRAWARHIYNEFVKN